ncbi:MAG: hypothetical protein C0490_19795 [Marivirga sp.]|nr:hypothetical protein [Marivirga sp.]
MRTSLNNIRLIEKFLNGQMAPEESMSFHMRLIEDPLLKINLRIQEKIYALIRLYHRKKLKEEIQSVEHKMFSDPLKAGFRESIQYYFKH